LAEGVGEAVEEELVLEVELWRDETDDTLHGPLWQPAPQWAVSFPQ